MISDLMLLWETLQSCDLLVAHSLHGPPNLGAVGFPCVLRSFFAILGRLVIVVALLEVLSLCGNRFPSLTRGPFTVFSAVVQSSPH